MHSLEKRIAALEATTAPTDDMTIIRRMVRPGHLDDEICRLRDDEGGLWLRRPGETEKELIDRATLEVKRNSYGVACLTADAGEVQHVKH